MSLWEIYTCGRNTYLEAYTSELNFKSRLADIELCKKFSNLYYKIVFYYSVQIHSYFQNLQMELNQLRCEVDDVRDSAISLMTKSDRYNKMVEPELSHLNQRWEEITEKLKVWYCNFLFFKRTFFLIDRLLKYEVWN